MTEEKMKVLARLPIKPCRIAFDDVNLSEKYIAALKCAYRHGIRHFSNYLLFNSDFDSLKSLYARLRINIELCEELCDISLFSFPMKYAPIEETNRQFVGKAWNRHFLKSVMAILNVTKGIVPKERDFFERAYGKDESEFLEILSMPHDMIIYRLNFEKSGITQQWRCKFTNLSENEKNQLVSFLSDNILYSDNNKINDVLYYYRYSEMNYNLVKELLGKE
ncbi:hypothetical protein [Eubacterium aggregans]|uniref:hypothetical protein n=1 Tax=Eubacterium aggregans TaxID=81409 RepID=UPI003F411359